MAVDHKSVTLTAVGGLPLIEPGDDLGAVLIQSLRRSGVAPRSQDVLVIAQKIVSKAEGRYISLGEVTPSARAIELAAAVRKDPRLVEVILSEAKEVVRYREGVLIVAHRLGFIMANAGIDQSNIEHPEGSERVLLLPENPDASCAVLNQIITPTTMFSGIIFESWYGVSLMITREDEILSLGLLALRILLFLDLDAQKAAYELQNALTRPQILPNVERLVLLGNRWISR